MQIKRLKELKNTMSEKQKRKLLIGLKKLKEGVLGANNTDIVNSDNLQVNEDEFTAKIQKERNVVAKIFDTKADYDSYVNQRRGIEMTAKEFESFSNYTGAKPVQSDKYFIKYENTDQFGNNETTIIKKLKENKKFCWTAFSKTESASIEEPKTPDEAPGAEETMLNDTIRISKTITFIDEIEGANILADFLIELDL